MAKSKVELFEQIRKAHEGEDLSVRALAERFGTHCRTVRQALTRRPAAEKKGPPRTVSGT